MVRKQIEARGVEDKSVLKAMRKVPRHLFVPEDLQDRIFIFSVRHSVLGQLL